MYRYIGLLLFVLVLVSVPPVSAMTSKIIVEDDRLTLEHHVKVNLTTLPDTVKTGLENMYNTMIVNKATMRGLLKTVLERYIHHTLSNKINITYIDYNISINKTTINNTTHLIVQIDFKLVVEGIRSGGLFTKTYDLRIRKMNFNVSTSYGATTIDCSRHLFLNLSAFSAPLEKWNRTFNGTHTIFRYHVRTIKVETEGVVLEIDPEESIVVEGDVIASGDYIYVTDTTAMILFAGVIVLVVAGVVIGVLYATKKTKHKIWKISRRYVEEV